MKVLSLLPGVNYWFQIDSKFSLSTTNELCFNWLRCSYLPFSLDHSEKMKRFTFFNTLLFRHLFFCKNCKNGNCYLICFCLLFILSSAERIKSSQIMKRFLFSKNGGFRAKLATIRFSRSKSKQTSNSIPGLRKLRVNWDKLPFCLLDVWVPSLVPQQSKFCSALF